MPTQAWLHALVWKEDGVCLLGWVEAVLSLLQERFLGLPAVDLYRNEGALAQVQAELKALLAEHAAMDCCLRSYRAINGTTCYRLCDTQISVRPDRGFSQSGPPGGKKRTRLARVPGLGSREFRGTRDLASGCMSARGTKKKALGRVASAPTSGPKRTSRGAQLLILLWATLISLRNASTAAPGHARIDRARSLVVREEAF